MEKQMFEKLISFGNNDIKKEKKSLSKLNLKKETISNLTDITGGLIMDSSNTTISTGGRICTC